MLGRELPFEDLERPDHILQPLVAKRTKVAVKGRIVGHQQPRPFSVRESLQFFTDDALEVHAKNVRMCDAAPPEPLRLRVTPVVHTTRVALRGREEPLYQIANNLGVIAACFNQTIDLSLRGRVGLPAVGSL